MSHYEDLKIFREGEVAYSKPGWYSNIMLTCTQVDLTEPILSRFDILCVVRDMYTGGPDWADPVSVWHPVCVAWHVHRWTWLSQSCLGSTSCVWCVTLLIPLMTNDLRDSSSRVTSVIIPTLPPMTKLLWLTSVDQVSLWLFLSVLCKIY